MQRTGLRPITIPLTAALTLLALGACTDDDTSDTQADTSTTGEASSSGAATTTTSTDPDATAGETTAEPSTSGDTTTGEGVGLLERIIEGIGGESALGDLQQVQLEAEGTRVMPDEGFMPDGPPADASTFTSTTSIDFTSAGLRIDTTRHVVFLPPPVDLVTSEIIDGNVGYVVGVDSVFGFPPEADMLTDRWASTVKQQRLLNPHFLLKELLADPSPSSEIAPADFEGVMYERLEVEDSVYPVTLWVDPATDLVMRLTTMESSHLHRDVVLDVRYDDWQATADGVLFPMQVRLSYRDDVIHDETRSAVTSNPDLPGDTFALPPQATATYDAAEDARATRSHQFNQQLLSIGIPRDGLQDTVMSEEVAPGVWYLTGGSHHTVVVEQSGGVVVFEAPLYQQRCEAILDWIDMELGGAPVTHVVASHHHVDHAGCVRTFVGAGATLVAHELAEAYYDEALAAPSAIVPDRLEDNPGAASSIEVVPAGGTYVIDDAINPITIFELPSVHAADLVLPYVESSGVAFTADVYSPGFGPNPPFAQETLDAFDAAGITADVGVILGGHGFGLGSVADLQSQVGG